MTNATNGSMQIICNTFSALLDSPYVTFGDISSTPSLPRPPHPCVM